VRLSQVHYVYDFRVTMSAVTVLFQQRLNEIAVGDFRNHGQVVYLFDFDRETLRAFNDFKVARPKRFEQLKMLFTYPRKNHRLATEHKLLYRSGLMSADLGIDWFDHRFGGVDLVKVLRHVGLLTAAPGRDWYAERFEGATLFNVLQETGLLTADAGRDWYAEHFEGDQLVQVLRLSGTAADDMLWLMRNFKVSHARMDMLMRLFGAQLPEAYRINTDSFNMEPTETWRPRIPDSDIIMYKRQCQRMKYYLDKYVRTDMCAPPGSYRVSNIVQIRIGAATAGTYHHVLAIIGGLWYKGDLEYIKQALTDLTTAVASVQVLRERSDDII
jgi:hypothetical protein